MTRCGVLLPTFDPLRRGGTPRVLDGARLAEDLGFDAVWAGDHLAAPAPNLDAPTCLAAAAVVTERVGLGLSVLLLGLRPPAWTAKQLVTIHALSGGRLTVGVGVGGEFPAEFAAAGARLADRGARVDEILGVLPELLRGRPVRLEGRVHRLDLPALEPGLATLPPLFVGGRSDAALRRAARFGDGWMPMWMRPATIAEARERLAELAAAAGRPCPRVVLLAGVHAGGDAVRARGEADAHLTGQYGLSLEAVERWTLLGDAEAVAGQLDAYRAVGVEEVILMPLAADPLAQYERLAEVRALLGARGPSVPSTTERSAL